MTGTPGAVVDLAVTAGTGTVEPAQVTIDGTGTASAELRSSVVGQVSVSATTSAPTLLRATKTPGQTSPQDQLFLRPGTLDDTATHGFIDCGVFLFGPAGPGTLIGPAPSAPAAPAAPAPAPLAITLESPRLAAPGGLAVYRLRVTNTGTRTARGVKVAQRVSSGLRPLKARGPRGTSAGVGRHAARWKVSALRARPLGHAHPQGAGVQGAGRRHRPLHRLGEGPAQRPRPRFGQHRDRPPGGQDRAGILSPAS